MLTLPQEFLLIAYDPEGKLLTGNEFGYTPGNRLNECLAYLALFELSQQGRIRYGTKVEVVDAAPTGDTVLDRVLEALCASRWKRHERDWIIRLGSPLSNRLSDLVAEQLIEKGCLRREHHSILGVFPADTYPTADPTEENASKTHLRRIVNGETLSDVRTRNLLAMIYEAQLEGAIWPAEGRVEARQRIATLLKDAEL